MKRFYILALAAIFAISCSLTNGATMSAAVLNTPTAAPQRADTLKAERIPTPSPKRCTVTAGLLNLRSCGGTHCGVLAVLDEGDRLTVLELGDWLQVETNTGLTGYINGAYCANGE